MTPEEVKMLMAHLNKRHYLVAALMYGSGLRVMEAVQLRVKDIDLIINVFKYGMAKEINIVL